MTYYGQTASPLHPRNSYVARESLSLHLNVAID